MKNLLYKNNDRDLVSFLYILMRDHLNSGAVESIMENHVEKVQGQTVLFTNEHLTRHAIDLAKRIGGKSK